MKKTTGKTKDAGFQFGLRKTFALNTIEAWDFMLSGPGLKIWLGELNPDDLQQKNRYKTKAGAEGEVRILKPHSHIRLTWKPETEQEYSLLQMRIIDTEGKSTIAFHLEKLADEEHRLQMNEHWNKVMDKLTAALKK